MILSLALIQISFLLLSHFVADFMMQSSWMAINKSKNHLALTSHIIVYTFTLLIAGLFIFIHTINFYNFIFVNSVLHWITDFFTSRINSELYKREDKHDFFVMIGCDQLIHTLTLIWTYYYFLT